MFSFKRLIRSHKFAIEGLKTVFKEEQSVRAQILIAAIVGLLMLWLPLSSAERVTIILAIMMVLILELINSQIERILDLIEPNYNEQVKRIKDISAGAVLIACLGAAFLGLLIFFTFAFENLDSLRASFVSKSVVIKGKMDYNGLICQK